MIQNNSTPTTLTDIDIPFGRLVLIILKTLLAAVPAIILMYILFFVFALIMFGVFGGGAALLQHVGTH